MADFPYSFSGKIVEHHVGHYVYQVVFLPSSLHAALPLAKYPRLRIEVKIEGMQAEGAWQPTKGRWYFMLSRQRLKDEGLALGDEVTFLFRLADQDTVEVPHELAVALSMNTAAQAAWEQLTPGMRRGLAHRVASALKIETRERRVEAVIESLTT